MPLVIWSFGQCLNLRVDEFQLAVCERQRTGGLVTEHPNFILIKVVRL